MMRLIVPKVKNKFVYDAQLIYLCTLDKVIVNLLVEVSSAVNSTVILCTRCIFSSMVASRELSSFAFLEHNKD